MRSKKEFVPRLICEPTRFERRTERARARAMPSTRTSILFRHTQYIKSAEVHSFFGENFPSNSVREKKERRTRFARARARTRFCTRADACARAPCDKSAPFSSYSSRAFANLRSNGAFGGVFIAQSLFSSQPDFLSLPYLFIFSLPRWSVEAGADFRHKSSTNQAGRPRRGNDHRRKLADIAKDC